MDILRRFQRYIEDNKLISRKDKVLVAVSAGRDSMLLLWLLHKLQYTIEIAHCNFQLRGEESDGDEALVGEFANQHNIPIHIKHFDTKVYAEANKVSIQMAARELRYCWFEELSASLGCKKIAVAHHMNDSVETVLFNLLRGTGLQGLQGILPKRPDSNVVRPLLFLQRKEIEDLVKQYAIPYRDDSSNFVPKYARNKIRLDIIPEFEKLNPDFISIMADNIDRFQDAQEVLNSTFEKLRTDILIPRGELAWSIKKSTICDLTLNELYFLLEPYGFRKNVLQDLKDSVNHEPGRRFDSEEYIVITDREDVILSQKTTILHPITITPDINKVHWGRWEIALALTEDCRIEGQKHIAQIDFEEIKFPLTIRSWEEGDVFYPLGMQGKKKLSDYFIQKKINILDKKRVAILVNGDGRIIWIVSYHLDERFKIKDNTQKVLKLVCNLK